METYMVEYTLNGGTTTETMLVSAEDYTKAYLKVCYELPSVAIITMVFKI